MLILVTMSAISAVLVTWLDGSQIRMHSQPAETGDQSVIINCNKMDGWMEGFYILYFCTSEGLTGQPGTMTMR